jgi:cAMP-dependent protein kinase regulator
MAMRFPPTASGSDFPPPQDAPGARMSESPVDHALTLMLAGEIDAAMRWAAAVLEKAPSPGALLVTSRLLDQMGRTRAATEGLKLAVQIAVDRGDLPLAVTAIDELQVLGSDVDEHLEIVASAFCRGSARLRHGDGPPFFPSLPASDFVQPLSPFLAGPALASKATQIVQNARNRYDDTVGGELPRVMPLPLFSSLGKEALRDVLTAFHAVTLPSGQRVVMEGDESSEAYVVVRGEVEISRHATHGDNKFTLALARLGGGAFFGEMALLSLMPSPASATTTRPSILLSAKREALVEVAANRPEIAGQLAAHCRRNSLANLGWTSQVVAAVPPVERATLVERLEMRLFEKGDLLVHSGEESPGLHLVISGEVAIVAREWGERVLLATLGAGDTVGEMELVLCRQPFADAVATGPTATLFLSRSEYASLIQDHPSILHGLYAIAVQRQAETTFALKSGSSVVADDWLLDTTSLHAPMDAAPAPAPEASRSAEPPPPPPRSAPKITEAEVLEPERAFSVAAAMPLVARSVAPSRRPEPEPAVRRTLPLPPPPLPPIPHPPVAPPPSSLSPTAASMRAPSIMPELRRSSWVSVAAVTGMTAVAASVVTILALRGSESLGTTQVAAAHQAPPVVDTLPVAAAAPTAAPAAQAPGAAPPAVAPTPVSALPSATSTPAATPVAPPPAPKASAVTPVVPRAAPAQAAPPSAPPAALARRAAASPPVARAETAAKPATAPSEDDEFGGRN